MRRSCVVVLCFGCTFDLDSVPRPVQDAADRRDAPVDGMTPSDGAPPDGPCATVAQVGVMQDTSIASSSPGLNFGSQPIMNVGVGVGGVGLYKFNVAAVPATARIQSVQVIFPFAQRSSQCSPSCGSCSPLEQAGNLAMFFMRSDWSDSTATWNQAATGVGWSSPGASAPGVDRDTTPAAMMTHAPSTSPMMIVTGAALDGVARWRTAGDLLSVQLVASNGAVFVGSARESANEACVAGGYGAAKMTITYCP